MRTILSNLQYGFRVLAKSPGYTAVAVFILALGIGATTTIFSVLYAVGICPLPYDHPEQLVVLWRTDPAFGKAAVSGPVFLDWTRQADAFSGLAAFGRYNPSVTSAGETVRLIGFMVTPDFFKVLGAQPAQGRLFAAGDDQPGREHVAVFGAGRGVQDVGKNLTATGATVSLDNEEFEVLGRTAESFRFPPFASGTFNEPDIFMSLPVAQLSKDRQRQAYFVIGRLKPGITVRQAQAQMKTISSRLAQQYPESDKAWGARVVSLHDEIMGSSGPLVTIIFLGTGFLLLIACANVAVLLFTQGARRQREIAIRQAVGASRARISMQLLTESTLLAVVSGAAGVLLAYFLKKALLSLDLWRLLPQANPIEINGQVLAFTLILSVGTGVLFGLIPALQLSRVSLEPLLREGAQAAGTGSRSVWLRNILVVSEVTLALSLLIPCGLMVRTLAGFLLTKPGFNPRNLMTIGMSVVEQKQPTFEAQTAFCRDLVQQVDALPGVKSSALESVSGGPVAAFGNTVTPDALKKNPVAMYGMVSPEYFRTFQLPVLRGRPLAAADYVEKPSVAVVNATMARTLWPNQDALGKRFTTSYPPEWYEVVGVVADSNIYGNYSLPQAYLPKMFEHGELLVRTVGDPKSQVTPIRNLLKDRFKNLKVSAAWTVEESMARMATPVRYMTILLTSMAIIALLLATVGVYAVTAFSVSQRTHEIGVRMALGSRRSQVLFFVMRTGTGLSFLGIVIGLFIAFALGRVLAFFFHGVSGGDVSTYLGVALLLLFVTLLASYIPARRAAKVDPVAALRCE
ncbi:MAG: ABC transporter permease [Acidobacteriota bacterium]|nr:ABC transporter permease [Acidobacteriota bacterium]